MNEIILLLSVLLLAFILARNVKHIHTELEKRPISLSPVCASGQWLLFIERYKIRLRIQRCFSLSTLPACSKNIMGLLCTHLFTQFLPFLLTWRILWSTITTQSLSSFMGTENISPHPLFYYVYILCLPRYFYGGGNDCLTLDKVWSIPWCSI